MTNKNAGNWSDPFQFQPEFETEVQSTCPHQESCLEVKNKKNDLLNYSFSLTPGYNSLSVHTSFHEASIQTPFVYDCDWLRFFTAADIMFELGFLL